MTEQEQAAFDQVKDQIKEACDEILSELEGKETKASAKRIRKATLTLQSVGKEYRRMSVDLL